MSKGRKFVITLGPNKNNRHFGRQVDTDKVFFVDGKQTPVIFLTRGNTYSFTVVQEPDFDYEFTYKLFFTKDCIGGNGEWCKKDYVCEKLKGTPGPIGNGTIFFVVDDTFPSHFYYQCRRHKMMGGLIIVK